MTTTKTQAIELIRAILCDAQHNGLDAYADLDSVAAARALCGGGDTEGLPVIEDVHDSNLHVINQLLHVI